MIWQYAEILQENTTADELNNIVPDGTYSVLRRTRARRSPWTVQDAGVQDRKVTETEMRVVFPFPYHCFPAGASHVKIRHDGREDILRITGGAERFARFTAVTVEKFRT